MFLYPLYTNTCSASRGENPHLTGWPVEHMFDPRRRSRYDARQQCSREQRMREEVRRRQTDPPAQGQIYRRPMTQTEVEQIDRHSDRQTSRRSSISLPHR